MKSIAVGRTYQALVDDDDFLWLSKWRWYSAGTSDGLRRYAIRAEVVNGQRRTLYMHRVILDLARGDMRLSDHINGDTLDNRRGNLRVCNDHQNLTNSAKRRGCTSRYKGVSWARQKGKWQAYIDLAGTKHSLGYYFAEDEAAEAYNAAAAYAFGEFARLNEIEGTRRP